MYTYNGQKVNINISAKDLKCEYISNEKDYNSNYIISIKMLERIILH